LVCGAWTSDAGVNLENQIIFIIALLIIFALKNFFDARQD